MTKDVYTLEEDMKHVLRTGEGWTAEIADWVANDIRQTVHRNMTDYRSDKKGSLRLSNLGETCDRKSWFDANIIFKGDIQPNMKAKFVFGDLTESFLLGVAMAAGHKVEGMQDTLYADGIKGHRDAVIDGMTFDVKSASTYAFDKFKYHQLNGYWKKVKDKRVGKVANVWVPRDDVDSFGYISQLSSYVYAAQDDPLVTYKEHGGFLAFEKQHGHIKVDIYDLTEDIYAKAKEVSHKKKICSLDKPPKREIPDEEATYGNRKLCTKCSYCNFKFDCWDGIRTFVNKQGPIYLTHVKKEPGGYYKEVKHG